MICQTLNIFAINRTNFHSFCAPLNAFQKQAIHLKYVSRNNVFVIDNVNYQLSSSVFYCAILKNKLDSYRLLHTLWIQAIGNSIYLSVKTFSLGLFYGPNFFYWKPKRVTRKINLKEWFFNHILWSSVRPERIEVSQYGLTCFLVKLFSLLGKFMDTFSFPLSFFTSSPFARYSNTITSEGASGVKCLKGRRQETLLSKRCWTRRNDLLSS